MMRGDCESGGVTGRATYTRRAFCGLACVGLGAGALVLAGCGEEDLRGDADAAAARESASEAASGETSASDADSDGAATLSDPVKKSTFAFNTLVSVTAYGVDEDVVDACLADCATYESLFSARREGTDVARVNAARGASVEVSADTADVLARALELGDETDGAFDVTIGAVSLLWDFVEGVKPDDADIAEAVRHVDYTRVRLEGATVTLEDPDARIDLGGIAKGWIADRLADRLRAAGCTSALVDLGTSSVYAVGGKPDGSAWRIGLRDPKGSVSQITGVVEVEGEAITSSGLYDQEFEQDGVTYWHILDPKTGYPAQTDMLGVTLLGEDPVQGDALTTALFTMGISGGVSWLETHHPELAAMFVDEGDEPAFANGFESHGYAAVSASE